MVAAGDKKILVVDDELSVLAMLKETLTSAGYKVRTAKNADEALKILKTETIMVMFLDLRLSGMNGLDLCWKIREMDKISIVYAFTGYSTFFGLLECRAAGFDDFFVKPVASKLILKAAKDAFEKLGRWKARDYDLI
ncbi:MAG: response regulator [Syntrophales bacterium]|jgi:DNA-binding NtrC family response regulator